MICRRRIIRIVEDIIFILVLICVPHLFLDKLGIYDSAFRIIRERMEEGGGMPGELHKDTEG